MVRTFQRRGLSNRAMSIGQVQLAYRFRHLVPE
jgi:hypothetical protein